MADTHTWIDPDGTSQPLDGSAGVKVLRGVRGRGMPPMETISDELAGLDGARPRLSRAGVRDVTLPVLVRGATVRERLRTLATLFDPRRGDGRLQVDIDGEVRELVCRYAQGLELDEGEAVQGAWQRAVVVFDAHDPMWCDVDPQISTVEIANDPFLSDDGEDPWFPWQLVESDAEGGFNITNDGDDVAWPMWTIQGPGVGQLTLTNTATGEVISAAVDLEAGDKLTIDTRPGAKTVVGPDGENLWSDLSDDSVLWPLQRGSQTVTVSLEGAEAGESRVRLEWLRRWLTV